FLKLSPGLLRRRTKELSRTARWFRFLDLLATFLLFPFIGVLSVDIRHAIDRITNTATRRCARVGYGIWWIYGAIPTAAGYLVSRFLELTERESVAGPPDEALVSRLEIVENTSSKNAVTILFEVRNSFVRRWYLWMILRGAELGCRHLWTDGRLTGINTIHYARIIQVD